MVPNLACLSVSPPAARTRDVMKQFSEVYEQQYAVALFNSVRFEIEGGGGPQSQLLHRKASSVSLDLLSGQNYKKTSSNYKERKCVYSPSRKIF